MSTPKHLVERPYPPAYLDIRTLAYMLSASETKVRQMIDYGELPHPITIGGMKRWKWEDVEAVINLVPRKDETTFKERIG